MAILRDPIRSAPASSAPATPRRLPLTPLLVMGAPRSGTTFFQFVMNLHPDINLTNETRVFSWLGKSLVLASDATNLNQEKDAFLSGDWLAEKIRSFCVGHKPSASYFGDKNPHYALLDEEMDHLKKAFPTIRIIEIVRHPHDVINSLMVLKWANDLENAIGIWKRHVDGGRKIQGKIPPAHFCRIKHEDLITDGIGVCTRTLSWLQLNMSQDVMNFLVTQNMGRTILNNPVNLADKMVVSHKHVISQEQKEAVSSHCKELMAFLGYS